jgi:ribonuclease P protein component
VLEVCNKIKPLFFCFTGGYTQSLRNKITKIQVLNRNSDFCKLYRKGKFQASDVLVTYVLNKRTESEPRIGITTSKKIGGAVIRNRSRRTIKEAYRKLLCCVKNGYDIVFVARSCTYKAKSYDIATCMHEHLKKLGVIKNEAFNNKIN